MIIVPGYCTLKSKSIALYTDGASRGNPGPAGIGIVVKSGRKKIREIYKYLGEATNNIAEYNAVICALEEAINLKAEEVIVNLDSELVVKQLNGEYKVKDQNMKELFEKTIGLFKNFKRFEIRHIPREKNKEADKLANKAINLSSLF